MRSTVIHLLDRMKEENAVMAEGVAAVEGTAAKVLAVTAEVRAAFVKARMWWQQQMSCTYKY